jgi:hypothetical protein
MGFHFTVYGAVPPVMTFEQKYWDAPDSHVALTCKVVADAAAGAMTVAAAAATMADAAAHGLRILKVDLRICRLRRKLPSGSRGNQRRIAQPSASEPPSAWCGNSISDVDTERDHSDNCGCATRPNSRARGNRVAGGREDTAAQRPAVDVTVEDELAEAEGRTELPEEPEEPEAPAGQPIAVVNCSPIT